MHPHIDCILGNFTSNSTSEEGSQNIGLCVCFVSGIDPVALANDQNSGSPNPIGSLCHFSGQQNLKDRNQNWFRRFFSFQQILHQ